MPTLPNTEEDANAPVEVVELLSRKVRCLNFVLIGNVRAGTHGLQTALTSTSGITCHANLLHQDSRVRDKSHIAYFGHRTPVFSRKESGASQYLDALVFDRPLKGEQAVGLRITYDQLVADDLFDFLHGKELDGDFCAIHVVRNPLVCFASQKQAEQSGLWRQSVYDGSVKSIPRPINANIEEAVAFIRSSIAVAGKVRTGLGDLLELDYLKLYTHFPRYMRKVTEFLGVTSPELGQPSCARLRNHELRKRISNYDQLMAALPEDALREVQRIPCY